MIVVDASALVAIVMGEPDAEALARRLDTDDAPVTTPVAVYEAVLAIARQRAGGVSAARSDLDVLLSEARIRVVPVSPEEADIALSAFDRFGKGRGHPAQLNMGDCFAYAAARHRGAPLLFKGEDFSKTDLEGAPG